MENSPIIESHNENDDSFIQNDPPNKEKLTLDD